MKIPVFLPVTREFGFRDEFAQDCLLQRRVCKLSVPLEMRARAARVVARRTVGLPCRQAAVICRAEA